MIKFLYRLFNQDEIDRLNNKLEIHRARTEQLEIEVREYKGYKLKYEVTKLYVDDEDDLLDELFEIAEKNEKNLANAEDRNLELRRLTIGQQQGAQAYGGLLGIGLSQGMFGISGGGF